MSEVVVQKANQANPIDAYRPQECVSVNFRYDTSV